MENIRNILAGKPHNFHSISPLASVDDALSQMCCENTDYLVVMDNEQFMGIVTEHDIASKAIARSKFLKKQPVKDIMYKGLPIITVTDTVNRCVTLMQQHNVRYMPVFNDYDFAGVISSDDIINVMIFGKSRLADMESEAINSYVC